MLAANFILGALMLTPWALWEAATLPPGGANLTPKIIGAVLYIGLGASLAAYFLWGRAMELAGPNLAGLVYFSLPFFCGLEAAPLPERTRHLVPRRLRNPHHHRHHPRHPLPRPRLTPPPRRAAEPGGEKGGVAGRVIGVRLYCLRRLKGKIP